MGKEVTFSAGDMGLILGLGRSPEGRPGDQLQSSCLENPVDRGAWWTTVHGVTESRKQVTEHTHTLTYRLSVAA